MRAAAELGSASSPAEVLSACNKIKQCRLLRRNGAHMEIYYPSGAIRDFLHAIKAHREYLRAEVRPQIDKLVDGYRLWTDRFAGNDRFVLFEQYIEELWDSIINTKA